MVQKTALPRYLFEMHLRCELDKPKSDEIATPHSPCSQHYRSPPPPQRQRRASVFRLALLVGVNELRVTSYMFLSPCQMARLLPCALGVCIWRHTDVHTWHLQRWVCSARVVSVSFWWRWLCWAPLQVKWTTAAFSTTELLPVLRQTCMVQLIDEWHAVNSSFFFNNRPDKWR